MLVSCWSIRLLVIHISLPSLKFTIYIHLSLLMKTLTVLILAVCRTSVTYELSKMTLLSMSFHSSVDRAPAHCSGDHGFDSCQGLRFFFVPGSYHVDQFTFHINYVLLLICIVNLYTCWKQNLSQQRKKKINMKDNWQYPSGKTT